MEQSGRILVVDDRNEIRILLGRLLEQEGYTVDSAGNGEEALALAAQHAYDLILLDQLMPGMPGIDVLRQLKGEGADATIPVLFLTGIGDRESQIAALRAGAADYIVKPFDQAILAARVRVHFQLRRQQVQLRAAREAAEDRNVQLTLKNAELERLQAFKGNLIERIGNTQRGYVGDLLSGVQDIVASPGDAAVVMAAAERLEHTAHEIEQMFETDDFYERAEKAMCGRTILVVDDDRGDRKLISRAVLATGADVHACDTADTGLARLREGRVDALFVDWPNAALIEEGRRLQPSLQTVLKTTEPMFEGQGKQMMGLPLSSMLITNFLARAEGHDPMAVRELVTTVGKLLTDDLFGLEKYLGWGVQIQKEVVVRSTERADALHRMRDYAAQCGLRGKVTVQLETLADELLMNAIWDAPADETGKPKYAARPRSEPVELDADEAAILQYATDGNYFGMSVTDPFGRLEHETAFRYIAKWFSEDTARLNHGNAGAGLGLYMAYRTVSSFVINVRPGSRTEVIGLLNLHQLQPGQQKDRARSFCYFRSLAGGVP